MRQKALVKATKEKYAVVEVTRNSMCDGCSKQSCSSHSCAAGTIFGANKIMSAKARNPINALTGDTVMVETKEKTVMRDAAVVFLMPLIICGLFYYLGNLIFHTVTAAYIASAVGFILAFCILGFIEHIRKEKVPDIVIVDILTRAETVNQHSTNTENEMG